jgi:ribosomal protein S18 acetylase RimI-like enzyme
MDITSRPAVATDLDELERLYHMLESEMTALEPAWSFTDGLPEPLSGSLTSELNSPEATVLLGCIDGVPVGFLIGHRSALTPQAAGRTRGSVHYVYTEPAARQVGVGEAMLAGYVADERAAGVSLFDAHVTPGHRAAKNFFESHGFSARSIVMNHTDEPEAGRA